ncbi:hypothetical protein CapIbe_000727 [Capra ibex]
MASKVDISCRPFPTSPGSPLLTLRLRVEVKYADESNKPRFGQHQAIQTAASEPESHITSKLPCWAGLAVTTRKSRGVKVRAFIIHVIYCILHVCSAAQLCSTLCDPSDCGSSVHGILQGTRTMEPTHA